VYEHILSFLFYERVDTRKLHKKAMFFAGIMFAKIRHFSNGMNLGQRCHNSEKNEK